jgi:DNA-binding NarL/FixJ family response regulator
VPLRCLIVDDNARFRESMRDLLESEGLVVVGTPASGAEAVRIARELRPDLALVDIDLGEESGFDVVRMLDNEVRPPPRLILISTHDGREISELVAGSGALGFLAKLDLSAATITELLARVDDAGPR